MNLPFSFWAATLTAPRLADGVSAWLAAERISGAWRPAMGPDAVLTDDAPDEIWLICAGHRSRSAEAGVRSDERAHDGMVCRRAGKTAPSPAPDRAVACSASEDDAAARVKRSLEGD